MNGFWRKDVDSMKKQYGLILISLLLGSLLLSACAGIGDSLDGTSWQLEQYRNEDGDLVSLKTDTVVSALFQADKVSGIAGCNNYSSSYQVDGDRLTFSPAATTRKLCVDPLGIMKQESAYLVALEQVQTFQLRNNKLEMQDSNGKTILEFSSIGQ